MSTLQTAGEFKVVVTDISRNEKGTRSFGAGFIFTFTVDDKDDIQHGKTITDIFPPFKKSTKAKTILDYNANTWLCDLKWLKDNFLGRKLTMKVGRVGEWFNPKAGVVRE